MSNEEHSHRDGNEECEICKAYSKFTYLLDSEDIPLEEAFHQVVAELAMDVVKISTDIIGSDFFDVGYSEGYLEALHTVSNQTAKTAEVLSEAMTKPCACEECSCTTVEEFDECNKDCMTANPDSIPDLKTNENFAKWMGERWTTRDV